MSMHDAPRRLWHTVVVLSISALVGVFAPGGIRAKAEVASAPALRQPSPLPAEWVEAWRQPPLADWPLQIVHAIPPAVAVREVVPKLRATPPAQLTADEGMGYYLRRGRGGLVCNVDFKDYLQSEEAWERFVRAVDICAELGMPVWIYDEEGYPSGAAGGLVLQKYPEVEAQALVWDPEDPRQFFLRPAFEHTHAANNYFAVRRYINIIDDRATRAFIEITHEAYRKRLAQHFGKTIVAFFTDEPSLMPVNLGQIPEPARSRVPVRDRPDPDVKPLPAVPWGYDLADCYRRRFGQELVAVQKSLFTGDSPQDKQIRQQFWSLIADLVAERYFDALRQWCRRYGVASSGHNLAEESILLHVPLYGNALQAIALMDIPGLDMLTSDPAVAVRSGWLTVALPLSGALLEGNRRVMTEVSDFSQKMFGPGPVDLATMQAAAAWQAAWGVTEFTLYYAPQDRSVEDNWQYGQFVGRVNAILKPAMPVPAVAVYYPIYDLWAEYRPVADTPSEKNQSERLRRISESFYRIGRALARRQVPFLLIDHRYLAQARVDAGCLCLGNAAISCLVLPAGVELPAEAERTVSQFASTGGRVVRDSPQEPITPATVRSRVLPKVVVEPAVDELVLGAFVREGRQIFMLVNVGTNPWSGTLLPAGEEPWWRLDPHTGQMECVSPQEGRLGVELPPQRSVILIR